MENPRLNIINVRKSSSYLLRSLKSAVLDGFRETVVPALLLPNITATFDTTDVIKHHILLERAQSIFALCGSVPFGIS